MPNDAHRSSRLSKFTTPFVERLRVPWVFLYINCHHSRGTRLLLEILGGCKVPPLLWNTARGLMEQDLFHEVSWNKRCSTVGCRHSQAKSPPPPAEGTVFHESGAHFHTPRACGTLRRSTQGVANPEPQRGIRQVDICKISGTLWVIFYPKPGMTSRGHPPEGLSGGGRS